MNIYNGTKKTYFIINAYYFKNIFCHNSENTV